MVWLGTHGQMLLDRLLLLLLLQHWLTIEGWLLHLRTVCLRGLHLLTWRIANLLLRLLWVKALIRILDWRTRWGLRAALRQLLLHELLRRLVGILHAGLLLMLLLLLHRVLRETSYDIGCLALSSLHPAGGVVIVSRSLVRWATRVCLLCCHGLLLVVHWRLSVRRVGSRPYVSRSTYGRRISAVGTDRGAHRVLLPELEVGIAYAAASASPLVRC